MRIYWGWVIQTDFSEHNDKQLVSYSENVYTYHWCSIFQITTAKAGAMINLSVWVKATHLWHFTKIY